MYGAVTNNANVLQFAWKDQQMVLFMTSVHTGRETVIRKRRRPAKTATNAKTSRAVFGEEVTKDLTISTSIDLYNHYMNGMDVVDQLRCYYNTQRVHNKTWFPIWHFLLNTAVINCYKIANTTEERSYAKLRKHSAHKRFREDLVTDLFENSERLIKPRGFKLEPRSRLVDVVIQASRHEHDIIQVLSDKHQDCTVCSKTGCKDVRRRRVTKPLQELSINSVIDKQRRKHVPRTRYGCRLCGIRLCNNGRCFEEHLGVIK